MSALATSALSAQPGRRDDAASLPPETPGQSLRHHGRETIPILPGQDDPDHVTALTQRAERRHFEDYPARRTERGYTGTLDATLTRPFVIHYHDMAYFGEGIAARQITRMEAGWIRTRRPGSAMSSHAAAAATVPPSCRRHPLTTGSQ
jgi:hypothetical protein